MTFGGLTFIPTFNYLVPYGETINTIR